MNYRTLGPQSRVSEVGFGCWQLGASDESGISETEALRVVETALDLGITFFDTADKYNDGLSEERLGKALKSRRHEVVIATKVGLLSKGRRDSSPAYIRASIESSLRRLQTDYVDLYLIHWPDPNTPLEESWGTMTDLMREGKVRMIGVSNFDAAMIQRCLAVGPVHAAQPPYNMFWREMEGELLPFCRDHDIAILPYGPQAHGLLSGKYQRGDKPQFQDWRRFYPFLNEGFDTNIQIVEQVAGIAEKLDMTVGQLAIAWTLRLPEVRSAIAGSRKPEHIRDQVGAAGRVIPAPVLDEIDRILEHAALASERPS